MGNILERDHQLFVVLNRLPHVPLTDAIALILSGVGTYGLIWAVLGLWIFIREERKDRWFFLQCVLAGIGSFFMTEIILKPVIGRFRPYAEFVTTVVGRASTGYSFPSGHATFAFALAIVLARKESRYAWWLFLLAILVSLSRIYLGQHYPLDILAGAVCGTILGLFSIGVTQLVRAGFAKKRNERRLS